MRRFLIIILCIIGFILSTPIPAYAATSSHVTVTAYGYICDIPGGFTLTYISDYEIQIDWIKGNGSINTMIRSGIYGYPLNISDGSLVYIGNGTTCIDTVNIIDNNLFYSAWSQSVGGAWTGLYAKKEDSFMSQSYMFMGMIVIAIAVTFFAFKARHILINLGAAISWLSILLFVFSNDKSFVISNPWVTAFSLGLFCLIIGVLVMYLGKEIDQYGRMVKRQKDDRNDEQKRQDAYRDSIRGVARGRANKRRR
jgi:hypothetical protein